MSPDLSVLLSRFSQQRYKPATFLERGIALPFTTPALLGGRIRPGQRREPELVLANPAGAEGVYILPWAALPDFCPPSLHDRAIWAQVSNLQLLTPRAVLQVARRVAAEGFAGRDAASAASGAMDAETQQRVLVHYHLLLELVRQGEPADSGLPPPERDHPANVEKRARAVLDRRKQDNTLPPTAAVDALEEIALAFQSVGLRHNPTGARLPLLCHEIAAVTQELLAWGEHGQDDVRLCCRLLSQATELTLRVARVALAGAHELLLDLWALLPRWRTEPGQLLSLVERAEWVLDGWSTICGLWRACEGQPNARRGALLEMAALVPMIPTEVRGWCGFDAEGEMDGTGGKLRSFRRTVVANQDWMSGRMVDLALRYESVRAIAV